MRFYCFVIVLALQQTSLVAQKLNHNYLGANFRFGFSNSNPLSGSGSINNPLYESPGIGVSWLIRTKAVEKNDRPSIPYVRTEFTWGSRSGLFDVNGVSTMLSSLALDLTVLVPASFKVNDGTYAYLSAGGNAAFNLSTNSNPQVTTNIMPAVKFGVVAETGLSFVGQRISLFGIRLLNEVGNKYGFQEMSFLLSINRERGKKRSKGI